MHTLWASQRRMNVKGEGLFGKGESSICFKSEIFTKSEFLFLQMRLRKFPHYCEILVYNAQICPKDYLSPLQTHSGFTVI